MSDREAIVDLHNELAATMDAGEWDGLRTLFTDDAVLDWRTGPRHGAAEIARYMREAGSEHLSAHRMISNHRIRLEGDRARAVVHYRSSHIDAPAGDGDHGAHSHEGWYVSELARTAQGWRFTSLRRVDLKDVMLNTPEGRARAQEILRGA